MDKNDFILSLSVSWPFFKLGMIQIVQLLLIMFSTLTVSQGFNTS